MADHDDNCTVEEGHSRSDIGTSTFHGGGEMLMGVKRDHQSEDKNSDHQSKDNQSEDDTCLSQPKESTPPESTDSNNIKSAENQIVISRDVRSTAVVKCANVQLPAQFTRLQENTNLNVPPANWLHGASKWESYLQDVTLGKEKAFASFKMANCYPDLTGEIDAISDAENIKKLLKIPYSKTHVSMMVHRVGNTLLLDDFDIHKHLMRRQQEEWQWLRKFYYETVLQPENAKDKVIVKKNKSRDHLQNRNMFSKFLYYSLADIEEKDSTNNNDDSQRVTKNEADSAVQSDEFQKTVVWTFEDLRMLIGTDLPIFGGETHPCVSLHLRDMCKPINVLTGLDYWLDNLMCNVPELAMCYHLDGIVQSYELIKTEDIPNMKDSKFSPNVVKDVAQNILSFLRSNATKEGHTYWLFKGQGDDIVKLYDLTTLCSDYMDDSNSNPFTVPVGVLLYRVARNMRQTSGRKKAAVIRTLLQNSLLLLDHVKHSQVVTSANFLLSDLYVSDDIYSPEVNTSSDESDADEEDTEQEKDSPAGTQSSASVEVKALCLPQRVKAPAVKSSRYPPITSSLEERCREAFKHVASGLQCLDTSAQMHISGNVASAGSKHTVEDQAQCQPGVAIPLHYQHLHTDACVSDVERGFSNDACPLAVSQDSRELPQEVSLLNQPGGLPYGTWHTLSKTLLLRKAAIAYHVLGEHKVAMCKYGQALKYMRLGLHCFDTMCALSASKAKENAHILGSLLGLGGDVHLLLAQNTSQRAALQEESLSFSEEDSIILDSCKEEKKEFEYSWMNGYPGDIEQAITRSAMCYELALGLSEDMKIPEERLANLRKRHGNMQNELGVFYMNSAAQKMKEPQNNSEFAKETMSLCQKSAASLQAGIQSFELLGDKLNMALLHSNSGRLMRLYSQVVQLDTGQNRGQERFYLKKATESYLQGLALLDKPEEHHDIWSSISWELSSTYFTMATQLQDHAPLDVMPQEQVEKEVTDLMMKALKYCACDQQSPHQGTSQYRAATIHHRLASLYHNSYRNQVVDQRKKHMRTLADLHYSRARKYFWLTDSHCELLRVQLERFAMGEFQLQGVTGAASRLKLLHGGWQQLLECLPSIRAIVSYLCGPEAEESSPVELTAYKEEVEKLATILESRINFTLQQLIKCTGNPNKKSKSADHSNTSIYKEIYSAVLKKFQRKDSKDITTKCTNLGDIIELVSERLPKIKES